jgi:uncharacterized protein (DUF58 family)
LGVERLAFGVWCLALFDEGANVVGANYKMKIPVPTRALLWLISAWLTLAVVASLVATPMALTAWQIVGGFIAMILLADWLVTYLRLRDSGNKLAFTVERRHALTIPVGVAHEIDLKVTNHTSIATNIEIYDGHSDRGAAIGLPIVNVIPAGRFGQHQYTFTPIARGDHTFGRVSMRVRSTLGLWLLPYSTGTPSVIRVFPNYAAVTRYALLALDNRLSQIGLLKRQRRGEGMDFHQLRDYRDGDSPRSIDWKATARHVKLIAREYQDERDQQVLFLLDCSRRMNAKDDTLSHFDHTLNAILLLTFVAIRQGDAAGLMTFGATDDQYLAPKKSQATVSRFLNALYPLEPTLKTPDYYQAALNLGKRLNKRALIIVVSNVRDEDEDGLHVAMAQLQRRHLVLFANLKEVVIEAAADASRLNQTTVTDDALITFAAATQYAAAREATLARMRARGVKLLDVVPEKLPMALVNRYLDMKQSGVF